LTLQNYAATAFFPAAVSSAAGVAVNLFEPPAR
jgi:hypothetical protein